MKATLIILLVLVPLFSIGQSKKLIKDNGIKKMTVYDYNIQDGKEIKRTETITKYNAAGEESEVIDFDKKTGKINTRETFEYNKDGHVIKSVIYNAENKIKKTCIYKYGTNGLRTEKQIYGKDGKLKSKNTYVYEK